MRMARVSLVGLSGLVFGVGGALPGAVGQQSPYYGPGVVRPAGPPVHQQQYDPETHRPCGGYMQQPCKVQVTIPAGATGEQVYAMAEQADANHQQAEAIAYLEKSAELGYGKAQASLGEDYLNGHGETQDQQKAVYWLNLAAGQGNRAAEALMGEFYENARGVAPDQAKAIHFYTLSAAQHYGPAERDLGLDYEFGRGVAHNRALAIQYLKRAAADGNDQISANYASELERAKTPQFHDEQQLVAAMNPVPAPGRSVAGCPAVSFVSAASNTTNWCGKHPGCPYHLPGMNPGDTGHDWVCSSNGGFPTMVR
jgi:cell division septum initiation protein DivIVA